MQDVIYIRKTRSESLLEAEDMAMLHILMEDYEPEDIESYVSELNEAHTSPMHGNGGVNSDKQTYMYGAQTDKKGKAIHSKEGKLSMAQKGFWHGLITNIPSIMTSMATYGVCGTALMAVGALHARHEQKWLKRRLMNPKGFADWIATLGTDDKKNKADVEDASTISYNDASTSPEKKEEKAYREEVEKVKKISQEAEKDTKVFYVENNNHEIQRVFAFDKNEAIEQAKILIKQNKGKYAKMNELFKDGAHTYRIVYSDNSVIYFTALDINAAKQEANKTAAALTKLYQTLGIPNVKGIQVKDITDEGMIELKMPEVVNVYEKAPDPNTLERLEQKKYPEFYTNDAGELRTYKLRANYTVFYYPAASDEQAREIAVGFEKVLKTQRGDLLNFITGSTEGMRANRVTMADGDSYLICTTKNSVLDSNDKALRIMKLKYDLLRSCAEKEGGAMKGLMSLPNKKTLDVYDTAKTKDDANKVKVEFPIINHKCAADIVENVHEEMPAKFRNHHAVSVVKMKDGYEGDNIYKNEIFIKDEKKTANSSSGMSRAV